MKRKFKITKSDIITIAGVTSLGGALTLVGQPIGIPLLIGTPIGTAGIIINEKGYDKKLIKKLKKVV